MKRLFTYISVLALAVSCDTMYGPVQTPIAADKDKADGIEITVTETKDASATFTLAPKAESGYYSYMVEQAAEASEVDSTSLYTGAYKDGKGVVKVGSFKWSAEAPASTVTVEGLAPNTTYQIYAVAATPQGFLGEVANVSFTTSDGVAPTLEDATTEDAVVELTFSEAVLRGEGALTVGVYAMNSNEIAGGKPVGSVTVAEENIAISGNIVTVTIEGLPAGAFYALNYPEGAFKDASNNLVAALTSSVVYGQETDWEPEYEGVGGQNALKPFKLGLIDEDMYYDAEAPVYLLSFDSEYEYGYTYSDKGATATYKIGGKTTTYNLTPGSDFDYVAKYQGVLLPLPTSGDKGNVVTLSIEAGVFEDYFGNLNEAWTEQLLYSYGYTLDDIVGDYNVVAYQNQKGYIQSGVAIAASDNEEKGNVMFTSFMGLPCLKPIYGNFNVDTGKLNVPYYQAFYATSSSIAIFYTYNNKSVNFSMTESGVISSPDDYFGYVVADASTGQIKGWGALYLEFEAQKIKPTEPSEPSEPIATQSLPTFDELYPLDTPVIR